MQWQPIQRLGREGKVRLQRSCSGVMRVIDICLRIKDVLQFAKTKRRNKLTVYELRWSIFRRWSAAKSSGREVTVPMWCFHLCPPLSCHEMVWRRSDSTAQPCKCAGAYVKLKFSGERLANMTQQGINDGESILSEYKTLFANKSLQWAGYGQLGCSAPSESETKIIFWEIGLNWITATNYTNCVFYGCKGFLVVVYFNWIKLYTRPAPVFGKI